MVFRFASSTRGGLVSCAVGIALLACGGQVVLGNETTPGGNDRSTAPDAGSAGGDGDGDGGGTAPGSRPDASGFPPEPTCPDFADPIAKEFYVIQPSGGMIGDFDSDGVDFFVAINPIGDGQAKLLNKMSGATTTLPPGNAIGRIAATQGRAYFETVGKEVSVFDPHGAPVVVAIPELSNTHRFAVRRDIPSVVGIDAFSDVLTVRSWSPGASAFESLPLALTGTKVLDVGMAGNKVLALAQLPTDSLENVFVLADDRPKSISSFQTDAKSWQAMAVWQEKAIVAGHRGGSAILRLWAMDPLGAGDAERLVDVVNKAIPENVEVVKSVVADYPKGSHDEGIFVAISRPNTMVGCDFPACPEDVTISRVARAGADRVLQPIVSYTFTPGASTSPSARPFTVDRCFVYFTDGSQIWRTAR